jgi:hypothetical protein
MIKYEVVAQYEYDYADKREKVGYAVCEIRDNGFTKVYYSTWWIKCFLRANRLTRLLGVVGYRAPLESPRLPE